MEVQAPTLLAALKENTMPFSAVIQQIEAAYQHRPTAFKNGETYNEATQNQGSAKVFAFAKLHQLNETDTLCLFAEHYQAVLANPNGTDHQNIRQFMLHGWTGIIFEGNALVTKD